MHGVHLVAVAHIFCLSVDGFRASRVPSCRSADKCTHSPRRRSGPQVGVIIIAPSFPPFQSFTHVLSWLDRCVIWSTPVRCETSTCSRPMLSRRTRGSDLRRTWCRPRARCDMMNQDFFFCRDICELPKEVLSLRPVSTSPPCYKRC